MAQLLKIDMAERELQEVSGGYDFVRAAGVGAYAAGVAGGLSGGSATLFGFLIGVGIDLYYQSKGR
jgi:hypothetical protein